ncbi:MAG: copper chaperone PCu(A)C [Burkholderiales bacterium]|jgi:copper(I)-binding protein|nr:copper chaperone PCu(A)C [Burkholderiales bacterium]
MKKASFVLLAFVSFSAFAQIKVSDAWVRSTTPAQGATGGFMTIKADQKVKVVGAESAVAGIVELHQMSMNSAGVMSMREVDALEIAAGEALELKPGGYHLMLMDLKKKPLATGDTLPVVLKFQTADGKLHTQNVSMEVRAITAPAKPSDHHNHHHHH